MEVSESGRKRRVVATGRVSFILSMNRNEAKNSGFLKKIFIGV